MIISKILQKLFNLPVTLRLRFYPLYNCLLFKLHGARYGANFKVFNKVYVIGKGKIKIGDDFMMTSDDCINPICANLRGCFYTEKGGVIKNGNRVGMSSTRVWIRTGLTIGDDVNIGGNVLIIDTDSHPIDYKLRNLVPSNAEDVALINQNIASSPITIEDQSWIGANCTILKGVTIGARSIIGAGSVVTKSIPADCIAAGNPARVIKSINE